ncbi:MAG: acyl-CoA dehydrogenase family protein [Candidatus Nezhaarchaeota archaeon]|nr:acyl-CoA dehydrogenase family protein [Candidatus Nezhaarchaeota archaeon]
MSFELTKSQAEVKEAAREFAEKELAPERGREFDAKEEFPWELYRKAAKLGFIQPHFPEEYGGQGLSYLENLLIVEEFCRADSTLGIAITVGTFGSDLIHLFGTEEQKSKYLALITSGEAVSAGAFTEPGHGSDITTVDTTAIKEGDVYVINGTKTMISNAPIASFFIVLCQTKPGVKHRGQTLFIVERGAEGLEASKIAGKLGIRASPLGEVSFNNVKVPPSAIVGEENRGFYHTLHFLDYGRLHAAAQAVGCAQGALERALKYAKERRQFGVRLADMQVIRHRLADMATKVEAARLLVYRAASKLDQGVVMPELSSMAKSFASTVAIEVVNEALQIFGGYGYLADYDVERIYRDVRITAIYEGTTEIQRNVIAKALIG